MLGSLVVEVAANVARFQSDMGKVAQIAEQNMARVDRTIGLISTSLKALGAGFAVGLTIEKVKGNITAAVESAAGLQQLAERTGATVEGLSGLASAAKLSGTDADALAVGLQKLSKSMVDAQAGGKASQAAFEAIGVSVKSLKGQTPDQVFVTIANRLAEYADGAEKTAVAQQLLGKSGANLLPVMKDVADLGELQVKVTGEQARMADEYEKNLVRLNAAQQGIYKTVAFALLPVMNAFVETMIKSATAGNGFKGAVNDLAADGKLRSWAESVAIGIGTVVEAMTGLIKLVRALAGSFEAVWADATVAGTFLKNGGPIGLLAKSNREELKQALDERNKVVEQANKRYVDLWNYDGTAFTRNLRERFAVDAQRRAEDRGFNPGVTTKPQINFNPRAGEEPAAGEKFVQQLQRQVEQQTRGRFEMLRLEAAQKSVSAAAEPYIKQLEEIDARQQRIKRTVEETAKEEAQRAKVNEFVTGGNDLSKQLIQQTQLLGLNAREQRRVTELRRLDEITARAMADATSETRQEILKLSETMRNNLIRALDDAEAAEQSLTSSFSKGAKDAFQAYQEAAANNARFAENFVNGSLQRMEDALLNFVKTGKLSFSDLFSFMAEEFLRQQIRMAISSFLPGSSGGGGIFGSLLSAGANLFGNLFSPKANGMAYVPFDGYPALLHEGERVLTKQENAGLQSSGANVDARIGTLNVGQGVSRGEVQASVNAAMAQQEMRLRRLIREGRV